MELVGAAGAQDRSDEALTLRQMLHAVAQPLTVLTMLLDEAGSSAEPVLRGELLHTARVECHRAVVAVQRLQARSAGTALRAPFAAEALG